VEYRARGRVIQSHGEHFRMLFKMSESLYRYHLEQAMLRMLPPHTIQWELKERRFRTRHIVHYYERARVEMRFAHARLGLAVEFTTYLEGLKRLYRQEQFILIEWEEREARKRIEVQSLERVADDFLFKAYTYSEGLFRVWNQDRNIVAMSVNLLHEDGTYRMKEAQKRFIDHQQGYDALGEELGRMVIRQCEVRGRTHLCHSMNLQYNEACDRANTRWRRKVYMLRQLGLFEKLRRSSLHEKFTATLLLLFEQHETYVRVSRQLKFVVTSLEPQWRALWWALAPVGIYHHYYGGLHHTFHRDEALQRHYVDYEEQTQERALTEGYVRKAFQVILEESWLRLALYRYIKIECIEHWERQGRTYIVTEHMEWWSDLMAKSQQKVFALFDPAEGYWRALVDQRQRIAFQAIVDVEAIDRGEVSGEDLLKVATRLQDTVFLERVERQALERDEKWFRDACGKELGILYMTIAKPSD